MYMALVYITLLCELSVAALHNEVPESEFLKNEIETPNKRLKSEMEYFFCPCIRYLSEKIVCLSPVCYHLRNRNLCQNLRCNCYSQ